MKARRVDSTNFYYTSIFTYVTGVFKLSTACSECPSRRFPLPPPALDVLPSFVTCFILEDIQETVSFLSSSTSSWAAAVGCLYPRSERGAAFAPSFFSRDCSILQKLLVPLWRSAWFYWSKSKSGTWKSSESQVFASSDVFSSFETDMLISTMLSGYSINVTPALKKEKFSRPQYPYLWQAIETPNQSAIYRSVLGTHRVAFYS